jgi:hypothetical protein
MGAFFNSIDEFGLIQGGGTRGTVLPQPALSAHPGTGKTARRQQEKITSAENQRRRPHPVRRTRVPGMARCRKTFPSPDLVGKFLFDETTGGTLKNEADPKKPPKPAATASPRKNTATASSPMATA